MKKYLGITAALIFNQAASADEARLLNQQPVVAEQTFLVGSWTGEAQGPRVQKAFYPSQGIYTVKLSADGSMMPIAVTPAQSPSWLTVDAAHQRVYIVSEVDEGKVSAYHLEKNGELTLLNTVDSSGMHPTHSALSRDGRYLLVANYSATDGRSGVSAIPVQSNGHLGKTQQFFPYNQGSNKVAGRQSSGHAHSVTFSIDGHYLLAADLGADKIHVYQYDPKHKDPFTLLADDTINFPAGDGPRHSTFSADGKFLYVTTEMSAQVKVFSFTQGKTELLQAEKLTDSMKDGDKSGAGLALSPDGDFLYVGNRGDKNQIVAFKVDKATGKLSQSKAYSAGGIEPRDFSFDASGRYLFVANVYSNNVVEFARDLKTGELSPTGVTLQIGTPTHIRFVTLGK
ncbi:lactonase family protein [Rosenbergiella australiborealis]|uniref:lactonase family protein n=1 Tax=Rosenbergiella australiborealis TaxID=1544696 RepID=UPI001F4D5D70|nr:lactonase family protein [Rosenbergiella australiborealis]